MINTSLYNALRAYCNSALALLDSKIRRIEDLPITTKEKVEVADDSWGLSFSPRREVLWDRLIRLITRYETDFTKMDAYKTAAQALQADPQIAKHLNTLVGTNMFRSRIDTDICLRSFLIQLLQKQQDLSLQEVEFNKLYSDFENYFYRDVIELRFLSPLNNFRIETEKIELNSKFSIIKITKEEREQMISWSRDFGFFDQHIMSPFNEYALELFLETPKGFGEIPAIYDKENSPDHIAIREFDNACSALRLFKNGAISPGKIIVKSISWDPHGGIHSTALMIRPAIGSQYTLSKEESIEFLRFWEFFQKVRQKKIARNDIALRRFNFAYERVRPEDRLIDYLIGFESLLLKKNERQELEYRLALRGSVLLAKIPGERAIVFKELKKAYGERSNIVHGGTVSKNVKIGDYEITFNEFVEKIEQRLRAAIKEFLTLSKIQSDSKIIENLDDKIVGGQSS